MIKCDILVFMKATQIDMNISAFFEFEVVITITSLLLQQNHKVEEF